MPRKIQFKPDFNFKQFGNRRLGFAFAAWLMGSWIFYQFLFLLVGLVELINMDLGFWYSDFYLKNNFSLENPFRDFFLAWISCLWAQSWAFQILISKRSINKHSHEIIKNDMQFLILNFIATAAKFVFVCGFVFATFGYAVSGFEEEASLIMILLTFVLFFQNWLAFQRKFKNSQKTMIYIFLIFSAISILFTQTNSIDIEERKDVLLSKRTENILNIDIPALKFDAEQLSYRSMSFPIFIGKQDSVKSWEIWDMKRKLDVKDLANYIEVCKSRVPQIRRYKMTSILIIDQTAPMFFVENLKCELIKNHGIYRVYYLVNQAPYFKENLKNEYFIAHGFFDDISFNCLKGTEFFTIQDIENFPATDSLQILEDGDFLLNEQLISAANLFNYIFNKMNNERKDFYLEFSLKGKTKFKDYLKAKAAIRQGFTRFRNKVALEKFGENYNEWLPFEKRQEISEEGRLVINEVLD